MSSAGLDLVRDAANRAARTGVQQLVVLAADVALVEGLDVGAADGWTLIAIVAFHLVASAVLSYVHRSLIDPTKVKSLEPPDTATPRFSPPPLEPPVPMG